LQRTVIGEFDTKIGAVEGWVIDSVGARTSAQLGNGNGSVSVTARVGAHGDHPRVELTVGLTILRIVLLVHRTILVGVDPARIAAARSRCIRLGKSFKDG